MRTRVSLILLAFLVMNIAVGGGYLRRVLALQEPPSAEFMAAALRNQESAAACLEVRWTSGGGKDEYHYTRTRDVLRLDRNAPDGTVYQYSFDRQTLEQVSLSISPIKKEGTASITKGCVMDPFGQKNFFDPVRYFLYRGPDAADGGLVNQIAAGTVSAIKEEIDGFQCWRVNVPVPDSMSSRLARQVVWVDADIGFCPRRVEFVWKDQLPGVVRFVDYTQVADGVWFPRKQLIMWPDDTGQKYYTITNEVTEVRVGPSVPKEQLVVKIPSGT